MHTCTRTTKSRHAFTDARRRRFLKRHEAVVANTRVSERTEGAETARGHADDADSRHGATATRNFAGASRRSPSVAGSRASARRERERALAASG